MTMVTEQAAPLDKPAPPPVRPRRVVLKLSGEVFGGGAVGVDPDVVQGIARQIATVIRRGIQVARVVGGGAVGGDPGVGRGTARQIATVIRRGIQVAVVVGGGNFFRGAELQKRG